MTDRLVRAISLPKLERLSSLDATDDDPITSSIESKPFGDEVFLDLSGLEIDNTNVSKLADALAKDEYLIELGLQRNYIGDGCHLITEALARNPKSKLDWLVCSSNEIQGESKSFASFCEALSLCSQLTYLDLSHNILMPTGAKHLAHVLAEDKCSLKHLALINCRIASHGGANLAEALKVNRSLTNLNLSGNTLGGSVSDISRCLVDSRHSKLESLNISSNEIPSFVTPALITLVLNSRSLLNMDTSDNIDIDGADHRYFHMCLWQSRLVSMLNDYVSIGISSELDDSQLLFDRNICDIIVEYADPLENRTIHRPSLGW